MLNINRLELKRTQPCLICNSKTCAQQGSFCVCVCAHPPEQAWMFMCLEIGRVVVAAFELTVLLKGTKTTNRDDSGKCIPSLILVGPLCWQIWLFKTCWLYQNYQNFSFVVKKKQQNCHGTMSCLLKKKFGFFGNIFVKSSLPGHRIISVIITRIVFFYYGGYRTDIP